MASADGSFTTQWCKEKNVLVTGGASGLGEGIVTSLAQAGAHVIIADKNEELGRVLEKHLADDGYKVKYVFVDVASVASQAAMLKAALAWYPGEGALDALILSAGINGNAFDLTPEDPSGLSDVKALSLLEKNAVTMQINLISVVQMVQLATKYAMGLNTGGHTEEKGVTVGPKSITLMSSLAAFKGLPRAVDYSASKFGIRGAMRSLRQQLSRVGIRINMIAPAFVKTPLLAETIPMYESIGVKFASKEDVVDAVSQVIRDERCNGRAYGVTSEGFVDLNDDAMGRDASDIMSDLINRGALGSAECPIGHDETK